MNAKVNYYFKFIVPSHYEVPFRSFKQAQKFAKNIGEMVYLTLYSKSNIYNEPYFEKVVTCEEEIEGFKSEMIHDFLTNYNK